MHVLVRAHWRPLAEGGELRLAVPADGTVARLFTVTGLHHLIPAFGRLDQALTPGPAAVILPPRPRPSAGRAPSGRPASQAAETRKLAARTSFELAMDVSGLRFADVASIWTLVLAAGR
jgi:hypothetical protein